LGRLLGPRGNGQRNGNGQAKRTLTHGGTPSSRLSTLSHGTNGIDGINGKDGAGFESWTVTHDGERLFKFQCGSGDQTKHFEFIVPIPIYRGRYKSGVGYQCGDEVMYGGGNIYRALKDTFEKPAEGEHWTLAANKGRDGRDGKDGAIGPQGPEGRAGRDLTQIGPDGSKW
jgi:integrin beta 3